MVKFACDCMLKMRTLVHQLKSRLGDDTSDLELGRVTAGVPHGEKSCFQLFGDTVNTAARMESNGIKGRIHCSQATAEKLVMAGREALLKPREGKSLPREKDKCKRTGSRFPTPSPKNPACQYQVTRNIPVPKSSMRMMPSYWPLS
jgi:hypothetical protein